MPSAAVFDLDNTLIRGSLLFHLGLRAMRRGLVNPRHLLPFTMTEFRYVHRRQEQAGVSERIARSALCVVRDRRQDELISVAEEFASRLLHRFLVPEIAALARRLQAEGVCVLIATASPQELAQVVSNQLGLSGAIGTLSEVVDGRYTGRLASPVAHGPAKALRVAQELRTRECPAASSWAFSDSVNDLPLLTLVGRPFAVRPDRHLRRVALQNGWPVLLDPAMKDVPLPQRRSTRVPAEALGSVGAASR